MELCWFDLGVERARFAPVLVKRVDDLFGAEVGEVVEKEDFEALAKELENASPLQIIDRALEKFGNDIAIAFRFGITFFSFSFLEI